MTPLVSVLMTAYNREKYIAEAIESVLASTYTNFELIIVDDCSKDNTVEIAKSFAKKDDRIELFINDKNLGDYPNRNKAASYAKGQFIMVVDSDDKILKDGIENCAEAMACFPDAVFGMYSFEKGKEKYKLDAKEAFRKHFFEKPILRIGPGGTIIKRNFFKKINGYPERFGPANDLYFNLKACSYSGIVMLPFEFLFYRYHEEQEQNNFFSYLHNNYLSLEAALNELNLQLTKNELDLLHKKNNRRFFVNITKYLLKTGNILKTKEALQKTRFGLREALTGVFH